MINNNLLYVLSSSIPWVLLTWVFRKVVQKKYTYWIDILLVIGSLAITSLFQGFKGWFALILFWELCLLSLFDALYRILPDMLTFSLLILGLVLSFENQFISMKDAMLGIITSYGILWGVSYVYTHFYGEVGIGEGDFKLASALGAWLGYEYVPLLLFLSSVFACGFYFIMVYCGKYERNSKIPLGIFLSVAGTGIFTLRFSSWCLLLD